MITLTALVDFVEILTVFQFTTSSSLMVKAVHHSLIFKIFNMLAIACPY